MSRIVSLAKPSVVFCSSLALLVLPQVSVPRIEMRRRYGIDEIKYYLLSIRWQAANPRFCKFGVFLSAPVGINQCRVRETLVGKIRRFARSQGQCMKRNPTEYPGL